VERASGSGDLTFALQRNLASPDGSGFSLAVTPFASLPTGGKAIGAGEWSAGLLVPLTYDLGGDVKLGLSSRIEAAADSDRDGRHLAYGAVVGLSAPLSEALEASFEIAADRDEDPAGAGTEWLAAISAGWMARDDLQLDAGANFGLRGAADVQIYLGVSRRF
jgi:Putative MetA-pathway of phenol degradation